MNALLPFARLRSVVAFDHCRVLLPHFTFAQQPDDVARLHRLAIDDEPAGAMQAGMLRLVLARPLLALVALRQLWINFRRYGSYVRTTDGISYSRQLRDLWHCVWHHNRHARHYYWRKLYQLPDRAEWLLNLEHRQLTTLLRHLNRRLPINEATNKYAFQRHCLAHDLPTPAVLAAWGPDGSLLTPTPEPVAGDVFVKPADEYGSTGIQAVPYDAASRTHHLSGRCYPWFKLLARLGRKAREEKRSLVLQPRLRNAARQTGYGDFDVCNLRIVTALPPDGSPEVIGAFLRMPSRFTTSGQNRHILFASVECPSGRMQTGRFREITRGEFPVHPETGAPIAGRVIPGWDELQALAVRAHLTFPWLPFCGWDLVDSDEGIMLLEANAYWGGDALQPPDARPLGLTRFPQIYLAWFDRMHGAAGSLPSPPTS